METWVFLWVIFCGTKQWSNFKIKKQMWRIHMAVGIIDFKEKVLKWRKSTISKLVTCDMSHITHDTWQVTVGRRWTFSPNISSLALELEVTFDTRHAPPDMWHLTCDIWPVTYDVRHMTCDIWLVTYDMCHAEHKGWWTLCPSFSLLDGAI